MEELINKLIDGGYEFDFNGNSLLMEYKGQGQPDMLLIHEFIKSSSEHSKEIKAFLKKRKLKKKYNHLLNRYNKIDDSFSDEPHNLSDNQLELIEKELQDILTEINLVHADIEEPLTNMLDGYKL